ncbi:MAG: hypothetical protein OXF72_03475, partial [Gammaproteobacteria bacterium]|nr:hypothetical protein [Gammaproteobacteria bacterium]
AERSIRIPLVCASVTAEAGDFTCPTGLTIHNGNAIGLAGIEIHQDDDTDDETFTIAFGDLPEEAVVGGGAASVELTVLDDDAPEVQQTDTNVDPQLLADVRAYAAETDNGPEHVERWRRVLYALTNGAEGVAPAMTSHEAQTYADKGWARWVPVAAALKLIDGGVDPYDGLTVSVADASASEGQEDLWFEVRLNRPAPGPVTVQANTVSGTARSPNDFQHTSREIRFEEGERLSRQMVWVHDDDIDEGHETMTFEISSPTPANVTIARSVATGTIENSDPMPAAWLARFGRTVADQALNNIADRVQASREAGFKGTLPMPSRSEPAEGATDNETLATAPGPALSALHGDEWGPQSMSMAAAQTQSRMMPHTGQTGRMGSGGPGENSMSSGMGLLQQFATGSFTHTLEASQTGGSFAWWGNGTASQFSGQAGGLGVNGEVLTMTLGTDYARDQWLAGVSVLQSLGRGGWRGEADGEIEASLTSLTPYAAWLPNERLELWSSIGHGWGTLSLELGDDDTAKERIETDLDWRMASAGGRGELLAGGRGLGLAVVGDALWTETASAQVRGLVAASAAVTRLRLGLQGSWTMHLEGGGSFTPRLELGARHDGGDAETGGGTYASAGLAWTLPRLGLALDVEGRTLVAHADSTFEDRGFSASFTLDPRPDTERGLTLSLTQEQGSRAGGGMQAMFSPTALITSGFAGGAGAGGQWTAEVGYGLRAFDDEFTATPRFGYSFSERAREYTLGWRLAPAGDGLDLSLGILTARRESEQTPPEHAIELEVSARW